MVTAKEINTRLRNSLKCAISDACMLIEIN